FTGRPATDSFPLSLHDALPISARSVAVAPSATIEMRSNPAAASAPALNLWPAATPRASSSAPASGGGGPGFRPWERDKSVLRQTDRKSTRLNSSHVAISYAVVC